MSLRTEPVRARSSARIRALIDATAEVVHRVGIERVTTNLIAEEAGCSIGTLYRYFPDRVAVLRALALQHASTLHDDAQREISRVSPDEAGLKRATVALARTFVDRYRGTPGWAAIGFGHALDLPITVAEQNLVSPPLRGKRTPRQQISRDVALRFSGDDAQLDALTVDLEVALTIIHALVDRAFTSSPEGDAAQLETADLVFGQIAEHVVGAHRDRRRKLAA
ncbi:TetR/AcrR family transcriptional regulator [Pseudoclavibacter endophyticus]|uniref:TetR/AcrR family transcriptional regulator n=1 Tax=Pseudoclavibacter endophyticus TaxID=1778590 RepID=UPI00166DF77C|nr:TetR/AcrR family transcriptional regulator [Pseudoclavibacter endophyticus]